MLSSSIKFSSSSSSISLKSSSSSFPSSLKLNLNWKMALSLPPILITCLLFFVNLTHVTWLECPLYWLYAAFSTGDGYLNNLTLLKSSPVTITFLVLSTSQELISSPDEHSGHIPCTGQPKIHVHVAHSVSAKLELLVICFPVSTEWNTIFSWIKQVWKIIFYK